MTVAVPWILWVTGAAVLGTVVAHLFSVGRPPELVLPTARFVPVTRTQAMTRSRVPRDRRVLLLRVLALLAIGVACAGVQGALPRDRVQTVLVVDVDVADSASVRAALQAYQPVLAIVWRDGRVRDGRTRGGDGSPLDTATWPPAGAGSLAGALLAARRAAQTHAGRTDSVALVLVSRLESDATRRALPLARAQWPGRITLVPVPPVMRDTADAAQPQTTPPPDVRTSLADDVVAAALAWHAGPTAAALRVVRADRLAADDSSHARAGGVVVHWPIARAGTDSAFAVVARGVALVTPLVRDRAVTASPAAIAWWPDGSAAVVEQAVGDGCVRTVGFAAPAGDALLSPSARGLVTALRDACRGAAAVAKGPPPSPLSDAERALIADASGALATPRALAMAPPAPPRALTLGLLALGALLLALEWLLRDRLRQPAREVPA